MSRMADSLWVIASCPTQDVIGEAGRDPTVLDFELASPSS